eukprot:9198125-Karenia_brevis.AAC.1
MFDLHHSSREILIAVEGLFINMASHADLKQSGWDWSAADPVASHIIENSRAAPVGVFDFLQERAKVR